MERGHPIEYSIVIFKIIIATFIVNFIVTLIDNAYVMTYTITLLWNLFMLLITTSASQSVGS
jgi:hypothetical protein